jgi:serine/threonine-protein kinase
VEEDAFVNSRVGTTLAGKYRVDALLGVGGMAAVFRGAHRNGNRVAIKLLRPTMATSADIRKRFLKEGYVANAVDHPGAVRVLDDDVASDGTPFLVMELLEGETLDARAKSAGPQLAAKEVAELAAQVLGVLDAAHAKKIVHRDIKPENLFVTRDGQVKVLDFGIARMRDGAPGQAVTRTGRMMGTPAFMPPEQALGLTNDIDGRTDLWALGATMFTLISGAFVHEGQTPESTVVLTATCPARSLASVAPTVPAAMVAVVDRALAFKKVDRHENARAMLASLAEAYASAFGARLPQPVLRDAVETASPAAPAAPDDPESNPNLAATVLSGSTAPDGAAPARRPGSTTAGLTSEKEAPASVATPASAPQTEPRREPRKLGLMVGAGILVVAAVGGSLAWLDRTPAAATSKSMASADAPPATSESAGAMPLTTASTSATLPGSNVEAGVDSGAGPAATALASAAASAALRPPPTTASGGQAPRKPELRPATAASAGPDCNPPFYFDPVSGLKKVKPGC